ncbi:MAG: hypothetical protein DMF68_21590 [Acidobacteria bacterium]|nr:MAG: hypothetical protein DMF68_21590 [Acidobacteriota bacterium]
MVATQFMRIKFKQDRQDEKIKGEMGKGEKGKRIFVFLPFPFPFYPFSPLLSSCPSLLITFRRLNHY